MKTLKKFDFQAFGAGRSDYDWDAILSGDVVQLTAGEDYSCKTVTFATLARSAARKRNMVLQTGKPQEEGVEGIVVKASPASEEQIAAWATADAEAKTKRDAKKAAAKATPEVAPPAPEPKKGKAGKGK